MNYQEAKIVFFGTPDFSVPALNALASEGYHFILAVTQPDKPAGRKRIMTPSPVKRTAQKLGLKEIEDLSDLINEAENFQPDLGVIAAYGEILPKAVLDLFPRGILNIHPSLLPKFRGPAPLQNAILNGEAKTGITIIKLDEKMDHGPIVARTEYTLNGKETYQELAETLAKKGADLLVKILPKYLEGKITPLPQNDAKATYVKMIQKRDGEIDINESAVQIERQIRAFAPWPGAFGTFLVKAKKMKIKIMAATVNINAEAIDESPPHYAQKTVNGELTALNNQLILQCGHGALVINTLQPEGKKEVSSQAFINGYLK